MKLFFVILLSSIAVSHGEPADKKTGGGDAKKKHSSEAHSISRAGKRPDRDDNLEAKMAAMNSVSVNAKPWALVKWQEPGGKVDKPPEKFDADEFMEAKMFGSASESVQEAILPKAAESGELNKPQLNHIFSNIFAREEDKHVEGKNMPNEDASYDMFEVRKDEDPQQMEDGVIEAKYHPDNEPQSAARADAEAYIVKSSD